MSNEISLDAAYQAYMRLITTMRKAEKFVELEMIAKKAEYVVGVADAIGTEPPCNVEHCKLHFFSNEKGLAQFVVDMSKAKKIYHCIDRNGSTPLLPAA